MSKRAVQGIVLAMIVLLCIPLVAFAAELRASDQPTVAAGETILDDLYIAGGNVSVLGAVQGDVAAAGGSILIRGNVSGDLAVAGGNITILGTIADDARVVGGNITIDSDIASDLAVGGGQITITGTVGGDLLGGGGMMRLDAPVGGDARIGGGEVYINSTIDGSVHFMGEKLTLGPSAVIEGDLIYTSPREATLETGAVVRGQTTYTEHAGSKMPGKLAAISFLGSFLTALACGLVLGLLLRKFSLALVAGVVARPLLEFGRGFLALVVLPVASALLFVTLLGIPLGILGVLSFIALIILGCIGAPIVLGSLILHAVRRSAEYEVSVLSIVIGALAYALLGLIPILGWVAQAVLVVVTIGAIVGLKWNWLKEWR